MEDETRSLFYGSIAIRCRRRSTKQTAHRPFAFFSILLQDPHQGQWLKECLHRDLVLLKEKEEGNCENVGKN